MDLKHEKCLAPNGLFKLFGAFFSCFIKCRVCSGGIVQVGMIPHTGNRQLKKNLYMCAIARFSQQSRKASAETEASKLTQLIDNPEISNKKIVCSIANRLARVAWTIAKSGEPFDPKKCRLLG